MLHKIAYIFLIDAILCGRWPFACKFMACSAAILDINFLISYLNHNVVGLNSLGQFSDYFCCCYALLEIGKNTETCDLLQHGSTIT